jgi:hypothetical protein
MRLECTRRSDRTTDISKWKTEAPMRCFFVSFAESTVAWATLYTETEKGVAESWPTLDKSLYLLDYP